METLPLSKGQLVDHEYIPVGPFDAATGIVGPGSAAVTLHKVATKCGVRSNLAHKQMPLDATSDGSASPANAVATPSRSPSPSTVDFSYANNRQCL